MNRRSIPIAAAALLLVCVGNARAQALCDSFCPSNTTFWTGWVTHNLLLNSYTKYDDTVQWGDTARGWAYWDVTNRPAIVDSIQLHYDQFYEHGNSITVPLYWIDNVDPTQTPAQALWNDLQSDYYLGGESSAVRWHYFSFPLPINWPPQQLQNYVLVGWALSENAVPYVGILGEAYGHTSPDGPWLCLYYH
jgi:hypothetical protein